MGEGILSGRLKREKQPNQTPERMPTMSVCDGNSMVVETEHGLLVAYGRFAEQIGLHEALGSVPFGMKTVEHSPQDKTVELLAHLLAGGMHLSELGKSAHPLVFDRAVAEAWGQRAFA